MSLSSGSLRAGKGASADNTKVLQLYYVQQRGMMATEANDFLAATQVN